jgi:phosphate starvation-inducible PhoH-like protein
MVVTGDVTQIDLPAGASGLQLVTRVLAEIDDVHFARLTSEDVVRHSLVGRIVDAYTRYDAERQARRFEREGGEGANRQERRARQNRGRYPQDHQRRGGAS